MSAAPRRARHAWRPPFWRGARGAVALAAWSIAGVVGAAFALLPAILEGRPRGRARPRIVDAPPRLRATGRAAFEADAAETAPAREAFPG